MSCQVFLLRKGLLAYWLKMTYNGRPGGGGGAAAAEGRIEGRFSESWVVST